MQYVIADLVYNPSNTSMHFPVARSPRTRTLDAENGVLRHPQSRARLVPLP